MLHHNYTLYLIIFLSWVTFNILSSYSYSYSIAPKVKSLKVDINIENTTICDEIKKRMAASIKKVAEKILIDEEIEVVKEQKDVIKETLHKVFSKVLIGFTISDFVIEEGKETKIIASIKANEPLIEDFTINIDYGNIHSEWQKFLDKNKEKIKGEIKNYLIGLPVASHEWTASIIQPLIKQKIEHLNIFVSFTQEVYLNFHERIVHIKLYPKGEIIRKVNLWFYSETLPNLYLKLLHYHLSKEADTMISLPIGFLAHYKDYARKRFDDILLKKGIRDRMRLVVNTDLYIDKLTIVAFHINSTRYRSGVYGLIDIGKKEEYESSLNSVFARKIYRDYEFITRVNIKPAPFTIDTKVGIGKFIAQNLYAAFLREIGEKEYFLYLVYKDNLLRMEFLPNLKDMVVENEISWGYYLREFLRIELVRKRPGEHLLRIAVEF